MRANRALLVLLFVCLVVLALPASAQNRKDSFELSPFVGRGFWAQDYDIDDSYYYGLRGGWNFTKRYELELALGAGDTRATDRWDAVDIFSTDVNAVFNYPLKANWRWVPYWTVGAGILDFTVEDQGGRDFFTLNYGGGIRWFATENVGFRADLRGVSAVDQGDNNWEMTVGMSFVAGGDIRDSDGDTVPDRLDKCPATPAGCIVEKQGFLRSDPGRMKGVAREPVKILEHNGCPTDQDGDTVCDGLDKCPDTPKGCKVDTSGCPLDADGDTVCDGIDQCPDTPKGCKVDAKGCPIDSDADTVCDGVDVCPDTPAGCKVDGKGCPIDTDEDGVCDSLDQCIEPLPAGCKVDSKGCVMDEDGDTVCDAKDQCPGTPRGVRVDPNGCEVALVLQSIQFDFDQAVVKKEFMPVLDKVAQSLQDNPQWRFLLTGHTDAVGGDEYNQRLGMRRAQAVKDYLVGKGVAPGRVEVDSKGKSAPIADNQTEDGRYQNRRTEFKRLQ